MKKIMIWVLSLCLMLAVPLNVFAVGSEYEYEEGTKISVSVPEKHKIEIDSPQDVTLYMDGVAIGPTDVSRLSGHLFTMDRIDENDREIKSVFVNGKDVTEEIFGDGYMIPSVYEDLVFSFVYADENSSVAATSSVTDTTVSTTIDSEPTESTVSESDTSASSTSDTSTSTSVSDTSTTSSLPGTNTSSNSGTSTSSVSGTSTSTQHEQSQTTSKNVTIATANPNPNNESPNTGDRAIVGSGFLVICSALAVYLLKRKKED